MAIFWIDHGRLCARGLEPGSIEDSVAKWRYLRGLAVDGCPARDGGCNTCALCLRYSTDEGSCAGCPVWACTGLSDCEGTSYEDYYKAYRRGDLAMCVSAAEEMVDFLEMLLEKSL